MLTKERFFRILELLDHYNTGADGGFKRKQIHSQPRSD